MKDPATKWWDFLREGKKNQNTNESMHSDRWDAPDEAEGREEARREKLEALYMEHLKPHAAKILGHIINHSNLIGRPRDSAEDFCHDLAIAAEGNDSITIMEFLLESAGENTEDIVLSAKEREEYEY